MGVSWTSLSDPRVEGKSTRRGQKLEAAVCRLPGLKSEEQGRKISSSKFRTHVPGRCLRVEQVGIHIPWAAFPPLPGPVCSERLPAGRGWAATPLKPDIPWMHFRNFLWPQRRWERFLAIVITEDAVSGAWGPGHSLGPTTKWLCSVPVSPRLFNPRAVVSGRELGSGVSQASRHRPLWISR